MSKIIIAIDGHSSTGKSTLAKQLAKHLGYVYVDTGAMYRAVTWYALENQYITSSEFNETELLNSLPKLQMEFVFNPSLGHAELFLNGTNVESKIRSMHVSSFVSKIATVDAVRQKLVAQQQAMGKAKGIVMDGRDIGTIVFPEAELKLFMTASAEVRAQRRYDELVAKGDMVSYDEVLHNVKHRDFIDSNRDHSPLKKAIDAIEIDNSDLSVSEQFIQVLHLATEKLNK